MGTGTSTGTGAGAGSGFATGTGAGGIGTGVGAGAGAAGVSCCGRSTGSGALGPGTGVLACTVSGNWVVTFSGTLDSGVLENTDRLSAERSAIDGRTVMARLVSAFGLMGCTYW